MKTAMLEKLKLIPFLFMVIAASGCGLSSGLSGDTETVFEPTEVGTPEGEKVTKDIGPAGGTLASTDGRLTLTVPQGALTETISFSIQPITNKAGNGLGLAYRLDPAGMNFPTPLEIAIRFDEKDLEGTIPEAFMLAFQDKQGAWHDLRSEKLDQNANTLTVTTTHFTDVAFLARLRMSPPEATVYVGGSQFIQLIECKQGFLDKILSRNGACSPAPEAKVSWSLRGPGQLTLSRSGKQAHLLYTAPAKKPTNNIAFVDLRIEFFFRYLDTGRTVSSEQTFSSKITILDRGYLASGQDGPVVYSGLICNLEKPFKVTGIHPLFTFPFNFAPSSATAGTASYTANWKSLTAAGNGPYTIEGADTNAPRIVWQMHSTLKGPPGMTSGGGPATINLTPLEGNECNAQ